MSTTLQPASGDAAGSGDAVAGARTMRIGEVAELTGTTPRTIRYYEEIGLLAGGTERELGKHRCYSAADVERINEIVRMKDLLGLSLDQLSQLLEAETARADIRREFRATDDPARQQALLEQSQGHIDTQLKLVRGRIAELEKLERDLSHRARLVVEKLDAARRGADARQRSDSGAQAPVSHSGAQAAGSDSAVQAAGSHSGA